MPSQDTGDRGYGEVLFSTVGWESPCASGGCTVCNVGETPSPCLPQKTQALPSLAGQPLPCHPPRFLMHGLLPHGHVLGVLLQPVQG